MKKRAVMMLLAITLTAAMIQGCGRNNDRNNEKNYQTQSNQTENAPLEGLTDTENATTESADDAATSQLQLGYALEIPKGFEKILPETEPNSLVEKVIAQYYNIPENQYKNMGYNYNYVDLNGDGKDEILAFVLDIDKERDEADEIDEETLLWISIEDENVLSDAVRQVFSDAEAPVYVSHHMTDGYRDLILREDEDEYQLLVWNGEHYQTEEKELANLEGYEGQAVLTMDANYHILGSAR